MLEPKTELTYKCFTEQIRENYQRIGEAHSKIADKNRGEPKMLEDKIEKSLLGKISSAVRRNAGVYLLAGGLSLWAVGCGPTVSEITPVTPECQISSDCSFSNEVCEFGKCKQECYFDIDCHGSSWSGKKAKCNMGQCYYPY